MNNSFRLLATLALLGCSTTTTSTKTSSAASNRGGLVVTYHPTATKIGERVLASGGNAFDAFVAATAAEYVLSEGVTSIGGPLGAITYDAKSDKVMYLDAEFNEPLHPTKKTTLPGEMVLVPGAIAGLEAISVRYGRWPFQKAMQPAIHLAEQGFPVGRYYALILANPRYQEILKRSKYGRETFFKGGEPLREGDLLKLPILAGFLKRLAYEGSNYAYTGFWAEHFVKEVRGHGGQLTMQDLANYKVAWREPLHTPYRGIEIYAPSGRTYGGALALVALNTLSHLDFSKFGPHYTQSAEGLETLLRVRNAVSEEPWKRDPGQLDNPQFMASVTTPAHADEIWAKVEQQLPAKPSPAEGTHSYQIVVIDNDGNAISGTNTIESMPWAQGLFVEGVPLTASGLLPFATKPGERRLSGLSMEIGLKDNKVQFASGAIGSSLISASVQLIVNIVDYKMSAHDAVRTPRFGDESFDLHGDLHAPQHSGALWLDTRIDKAIVATLESRGFKFSQEGFVDTGFGAVGIVRSNGHLDGDVAPLFPEVQSPPPAQAPAPSPTPTPSPAPSPLVQ